jgi:ferritin-like protein
MRGGQVQRALAALAAAGALAAGLGACGGGGGEETATAATEKAADGAVMNEVLARQSGATAAYEQVIPGLRGRDLTLARKFQAQEQEHMDAVVKALRGLGAAAERTPEKIDASAPKSPTERLEFLYTLESATIDFELSAISKLSSAWPRALLGSIVANQAQHLALLRRALGAKPLQTVPSAFENGTAPAP